MRTKYVIPSLEQRYNIFSFLEIPYHMWICIGRFSYIGSNWTFNDCFSEKLSIWLMIVSILKLS